MQKINVLAKLSLFFLFLGLCGCANELLRSDFTNYSLIYGDESNKELLLNLARLANDDPVYYIQLGTISSQYQITTSLQFNAGNTRTTPNSAGSGPQNALALSGQANLGAVQTPVFSFVPLTGSNFVQAVLNPITPTVYLTFFDQGYPADLIARTMVASIEWQHIQPDGKTNIEVLVNDPHDPTYGDFLNFCANFRNAQLSRMMTVSSVSGAITTNVIYGRGERNPLLGDVVNAIGANISVSTDPHQNVIVSQAQQKLELTPEQTLGVVTFAPYVNSQFDTQRPTYNTMPTQLKFEKCNEILSSVGKTIKLKTRTFEAAMYCVAKQEVYFRNLETNIEANPAPSRVFYSHDNYGPYAIVTNYMVTYEQTTNISDIPETNIFYTLSDVSHSSPVITNISYSLLKVRPTMLVYDEASVNENCEPILCSTPYQGKTYQVTDIKGSDNPNQTVFTMLSYLFAETAIATQNLPVQQLIQVQ